MDDHMSQINTSLSDDIILQDNPIFNDADLQEEGSNPKNNYENRRHLRSIFTYPVELTVFTNKSEHITFIGYLRDISTSGACVEFEDKYGRYNMNEIKNTKTKISFSILEGEKVDIFAQAKWVKKATDRTVSMNIGIEFKYMESWDVIDKLIGMKNKDRNMMWNLWEHFFK